MFESHHVISLTSVFFRTLIVLLAVVPSVIFRTLECNGKGSPLLLDLTLSAVATRSLRQIERRALLNSQENEAGESMFRLKQSRMTYA